MLSFATEVWIQFLMGDPTDLSVTDSNPYRHRLWVALSTLCQSLFLFPVCNITLPRCLHAGRFRVFRS